MSLADQILAINQVIQQYMHDHGAHAITADEGADVVSSAGILSPVQGPPDAPAFTFRRFLRDVRDQYGHEALFQLLGVKQKENRSHGHYILLRFDPPSRERVDELLKITGHIDTPEQGATASLPDFLQDGLDVVFVGISAGEESARREHYYADPHDRFWDLVNQAGLISDMVGAENDHLVLDEKCGLSDLSRRTLSSSDPPQETTDSDFDIEGFIRKIEKHKPKAVAFNGKRAYKEVFREDPKEYGLADEIVGDSYVFVLPSSSSTDTSMPFEKKLHWYRKLKATLRTL